jgi:hypothetical protein
MPRRKSKETERRWREILERQAGGALSIRGFCEAEGVSTASFYNWRRRLLPGRRGRRPVRQAQAQAQADDHAGEATRDQSLFVPLAMLGMAPTLEILHPRGCRVRVTGDVGVVALRRVLEALDQGDAQ